MTRARLQSSINLTFTTQAEDLRHCNCHIVTVPTPIDAHNRPELQPLLLASEAVARALKPGDIVIYEPTVYPGETEQDCVPVLEKISGLQFNQDFFGGYSPERINPGDKTNRVNNINISSESTRKRRNR